MLIASRKYDDCYSPTSANRFTLKASFDRRWFCCCFFPFAAPQRRAHENPTGRFAVVCFKFFGFRVRLFMAFHKSRAYKHKVISESSTDDVDFLVSLHNAFYREWRLLLLFDAFQSNIGAKLSNVQQSVRGRCVNTTRYVCNSVRACVCVCVCECVCVYVLISTTNYDIGIELITVIFLFTTRLV